MHRNGFGWAEEALDADGGPWDAALLDACVYARVAEGAAYLASTGRGPVDLGLLQAFRGGALPGQ